MLVKKQKPKLKIKERSFKYLKLYGYQCLNFMLLNILTSDWQHDEIHERQFDTGNNLLPEFIYWLIFWQHYWIKYGGLYVYKNSSRQDLYLSLRSLFATENSQHRPSHVNLVCTVYIYGLYARELHRSISYNNRMPSEWFRVQIMMFRKVKYTWDSARSHSPPSSGEPECRASKGDNSK